MSNNSLKLRLTRHGHLDRNNSRQVFSIKHQRQKDWTGILFACLDNGGRKSGDISKDIECVQVKSQECPEYLELDPAKIVGQKIESAIIFSSNQQKRGDFGTFLKDSAFNFQIIKLCPIEAIKEQSKKKITHPSLIIVDLDERGRGALGQTTNSSFSLLLSALKRGAKNSVIVALSAFNDYSKGSEGLKNLVPAHYLVHNSTGVNLILEELSKIGLIHKKR